MSDVKLTKEQKKAAKAARRAQALAERGDDGEAKKAEALKNKGPQKEKPAQKEKSLGGPKVKNPVEQVKQEGRVRKISERSVPKRVATKTQHTQAELVEPLFTYMRSSVGITDLIQNMGFSTKDPFSKSDKPIKLHPAIIRLGFKAANSHISAHESATGRAKRLMEAITLFIEDFEGRQFEENNDVIDIRHSSIPQQFLQELNPNINFLSKCRPLVRSEACVIDCVKDNAKNGSGAAKIGISEFKKYLIEQLDYFWSTRVTSAGLTICSLAQPLIKENSTVLTFGGSRNVYRIFEQAQRSGTEFSVIVIDCEPDYRGKSLFKELKAIDVDTRYATVAGLSYLMAESDMVLLAAQSLLANGSVMCAKGSGIVACVAKEDQVPVLVCCESYKFDDRCAINALDNKNELREFQLDQSDICLTDIVHDVIPASLVTAAITEVGIIPSTSVATVITENDKKRKDLEDDFED